MSDQILLVDDDKHVLDGYRRILSREFLLETAQGSEEALTQIQKSGPYAVVVSDMRMPGMNGVELLSTVKATSPDTVRIMITGYAELETAITRNHDANRDRRAHV